MSSRSAAVKRLMKEYADLEQDPSPDFVAYPINDSNVFEWHFTLRGPDEGGFQGGKYHGRIVFPVDYPFKPPDMYFLTPNGRFELNKKICLSITGFHAETWRPAWGIRSALTALISFFPTEGNGAIGALDYTPEERAMYAKKSLDWACTGICERCEGIKMKDLLTDELLGAEKKKVEGADEISFYSKGSTESVVGTPVVADGATPPSGSESRAQSPIRPASPVRPDSPIRMGADGAEEGLRHRVVASASPNASTTPAATAALPARIVPQASAEYIRFHTRRRQIDTVILGLMGLIFYVVLRRLGIIFSSQ